MTPEGAVKKEIKEWLDKGGFYRFMPVQMGYGAAGLDIYCCIWGRFVAIETKRPGEKHMKPRQQFVAERIRAAGGIAIKVNSLADLIEQLETLGVINP